MAEGVVKVQQIKVAQQCDKSCGVASVGGGSLADKLSLVVLQANEILSLSRTTYNLQSVQCTRLCGSLSVHKRPNATKSYAKRNQHHYDAHCTQTTESADSGKEHES